METGSHTGTDAPSLPRGRADSDNEREPPPARWAGFSEAWILGLRKIYAIRLVRGRLPYGRSVQRSPFAMARWILLSFGPAAATVAVFSVTDLANWRISSSDASLVVLLGLVNAGMFAAASLAWRFPLPRTPSIDDLIRPCAERDEIAGVMTRGYRWYRQLPLPLVGAAVPVAIYLRSGDVGDIATMAVVANIAWTLFLLGNVSYWLLVPPFALVRMRKCHDIVLRWNDPARTPGIRTFSEGFTYPAVFIALGALAVTAPGLLGYQPLLGVYQPYLYGILLALSLWVGGFTQFIIFGIVRRFRLRVMDTLAADPGYLMSESESPEILLRASRNPDMAITLSAYNSVAGAPGLPYGTGLVVQYLAAVIGSVVGFLLQ